MEAHLEGNEPGCRDTPRLDPWRTISRHSCRSRVALRSQYVRLADRYSPSPPTFAIQLPGPTATPDTRVKLLLGTGVQDKERSASVGTLTLRALPG
jgi:hypothetical protein